MKNLDEDRKYRGGITVLPPDAMPTEKAWNSRVAQDELHARPPEGHELRRERDIVMHMQVERAACSCGWRGAWSRIHSTL